MFDQLFSRSGALTRQLSAPLVDERRQYLTHCAVQGMTKSTLEAKARLLLSIAEYLRLAERPNHTITLLEIKKSGKPMVEAQLAFAGKLARQAVARILHGTGGQVADLSQPSPDSTQTGNGLRPGPTRLFPISGLAPRLIFTDRGTILQSPRVNHPRISTEGESHVHSSETSNGSSGPR